MLWTFTSFFDCVVVDLLQRYCVTIGIAFDGIVFPVELRSPFPLGSRNRKQAVAREVCSELAVPAIVVQGNADPLVPVAGTRRWIDKMKERKMTQQYVEVEGGDHGNVIGVGSRTLLRSSRNTINPPAKSGVWHLFYQFYVPDPELIVAEVSTRARDSCAAHSDIR